MDGDGVQQAFCPLLWRANGGEFTASGRPRLPLTGEPVRGMCTKAYDCDQCELMQAELSLHAPGMVWWCCQSCVSRLKSRRDDRGHHLRLPGFYTEGYCQNPSCQRDAEDRYSSLLQLVLGDIQKEGG